MMQNRFAARLVFFLIFFLIYSVVRGAIGPDNAAGLFIAPAVAGIATVAFSYWIRARNERG
ncbi:MAG: hypothetical protein QOF21_2766 [Actinomycetota bacterium]|jgi:hypothetical protein